MKIMAWIVSEAVEALTPVDVTLDQDKNEVLFSWAYATGEAISI